MHILSAKIGSFRRNARDAIYVRDVVICLNKSVLSSYEEPAENSESRLISHHLHCMQEDCHPHEREEKKKMLIYGYMASDIS